MALDLSSYSAEVDSPEVAELKERVRTVAKKYTDRHGWCSAVNSALKECGISTEEKKVPVKILFSVSGSEPTEAVKKFKVSDLINLSHDEQIAYIAEQIAPKVSVAGVSVTLPVNVSDISLHEGDAPLEASDYRGHRGFFTSLEGRVRHLTRQTFETEEAYTSHIASARYASSLCGSGDTYGPSLTSQRDEGRVCANCQRVFDRIY